MPISTNWFPGKDRLTLFCISAIIAFSISITLVFRFFQNTYVLYDAHGIIVFLTSLLSPAVYFLIDRQIRPRLTASYRSIALGAAYSVIAGIVLLFAIPLPLPMDRTTHRLEILATGLKGPLATGSAVSVGALCHDSTPLIAPEDFKHDGKWTMRSDKSSLYIDPVTNPQRMWWEGVLPAFATPRISVGMIIARNMGVVELNWDGHVQQIDLGQDTPPGGVLNFYSLTVKPASRLTRFFHLITAGMAIGFLLFTITVCIAFSSTVRHVAQPISRGWLVFGYSAPSLVVWTVYLLIHWPGMLSNDSYYDWYAAIHHKWFDKPAMNQFTIWAISRFWFSPGAVTLFYQAVFSVLIGWAICRLQYFGLPKYQALAIAFFFALFPTNARVVTWLLNDMPFNICVLAFSLVILEVVQTRGAWLSASTRNWILLAIVAASTGLYRHNGLWVSICTLGVLIVTNIRFIRPLVYAFVLAISIIAIVRGPIYRALKVEEFQAKTNRMVISSLFVWPIMAHVHKNAPLTEDENKVLHDWDPQNTGFWKSYVPNQYLISNPCWNPNFPKDKCDNFDWRITAVWWNLTWRAPGVTINHHLDAGAFVWQIDSGAIQTFHFLNDGHRLVRNNFKPPYTEKAEALIPFGPEWSLDLLSWIEKHQWLFWRPALWMYVLLFFGVIGILRNGSWRHFLIVTPQFLNALIIGLSANTPEVRYLYTIITACHIFAFYFAVKHPELHKNGLDSPPASIQQATGIQSSVPPVLTDNPRL